jgi:hypothetical protein
VCQAVCGGMDLSVFLVTKFKVQSLFNCIKLPLSLY